MNALGSMLIRKYLLIVLLCLTSLSTVGLGISTAILDYRNKVLRNGYQTQSNTLQKYMKDQNECTNVNILSGTNYGSAYIIRNQIYNAEEGKEEEITKYVNINMINLTTPSQRRLRGETSYQVINSSIEQLKDGIPPDQAYINISIQSDGSLILNASDNNYDEESQTYFSSQFWGFPWSQVAIQSNISIRGQQPLIVNQPIMSYAADTADFAVELNTIKSVKGNGGIGVNGDVDGGINVGGNVNGYIKVKDNINDIEVGGNIGNWNQQIRVKKSDDSEQQDQLETAIKISQNIYGNIIIGTSDDQTAGKVEGNILLNSVSSVKTNDESVEIQNINPTSIGAVNTHQLNLLNITNISTAPGKVDKVYITGGNLGQVTVQPIQDASNNNATIGGEIEKIEMGNDIIIEGDQVCNTNSDTNDNISLDRVKQITAECVEEIIIRDGTCLTNFQNGQISITGIKSGQIDEISIPDEEQAGQISITGIKSGYIDTISIPDEQQAGQTSITGIKSGQINTISVSKSYDASIPAEQQQPGYIGSITTIGYDIGSINVQSAVYEDKGMSYKLGGSVSNGISVSGSVTGEICVQNDVNGNINIGGQVQGNGNDNAVVQFGGINAGNGTGQALSIGNTSLDDGVSVKGSINIDGQINVQNANSNAFSVGSISGNYSTGIQVISDDTTNTPAISGFNKVGVNITGNITAQYQVNEQGEEEFVKGTIGVNVTGNVTVEYMGIRVAGDVNGAYGIEASSVTATSGTGIYVKNVVSTSGNGIIGYNVTSKKYRGILIHDTVKGGSYDGAIWVSKVIGDSDTGIRVGSVSGRYQGISAGSVTARQGVGIDVDSVSAKDYGINAGNVTVTTGTGIYANRVISESGTGINVNSVSGNYGMYAGSISGGTYGIQIGGSVTATSGTGIKVNKAISGSTYGIEVGFINTSSTNKSDIGIKIANNITSNGTAISVGTKPNEGEEYKQVIVSNITGIDVIGSLTSSGVGIKVGNNITSNGIGVKVGNNITSNDTAISVSGNITSNGGSYTNYGIEVGRDVTSTAGTGIMINGGVSAKQQIGIYVEENIESNDYGIYVKENIESNDYGIYASSITPEKIYIGDFDEAYEVFNDLVDTSYNLCPDSS